MALVCAKNINDQEKTQSKALITPSASRSQSTTTQRNESSVEPKRKPKRKRSHVKLTLAQQWDLDNANKSERAEKTDLDSLEETNPLANHRAKGTGEKTTEAVSAEQRQKRLLQQRNQLEHTPVPPPLKACRSREKVVTDEGMKPRKRVDDSHKEGTKAGTSTEARSNKISKTGQTYTRVSTIIGSREGAISGLIEPKSSAESIKAGGNQSLVRRKRR